MRGLLRIAALTVALSGCTQGNPTATDPTERGLSYVATAIVIAAVLRGIFNA